MSRIDTFTFRVNADERQLLTAVAERLARTESDAVRWLVRKAARELNVVPQDCAVKGEEHAHLAEQAV